MASRWLARAAVLTVAGCAAAPAPAPVPGAASSASPGVASASPADAAGSGTCEGDTFDLAPGGAQISSGIIARKRGTMGTATRQMVAASHRLSTEAGLAILRSGGNAADAFVAAALVDDVVLPGVTSTAGLAGVLVYEAKTGKLTYVHGGFADAIDPARRIQPGDRDVGKQVLVPGAPAAYAEITRRFGSKPLRELVEPAAKLASAGFPADALYAGSIAASAAKLGKSAYGRKAFFHDGKPIAEGGTIKLDDLARTLRAFGNDPTLFYRSAWTREAVVLVHANGGVLKAQDFATYAVQVGPPMHTRFAGYDVYAGGWGGARLLVSLGALDLLARDGTAAGNIPADAVETLLRVHHEVGSVVALAARNLVTMGAAADELVAQSAAGVADRVRAKAATTPKAEGGAHSSAVVVVDAQGNVVVGTHSIETLNWGEGLFVGGVPLSTAGPINGDDAPSATERVRADPLSDTIVLDHGVPRVALGVYGTSLFPADIEVLDGVLLRGRSAEDAVLAPRVGSFQLDLTKMSLDVTRNVVDPRVPTDLLCALKARGFALSRSIPGYPPGIVDTGFPTVITMVPGKLTGMTPELVDGVAEGD
jgi:gamma-glutamyltranspeptidase / glutathione hydrolase